MVPLLSSFLVVDILPGGGSDGAAAGALRLFPVGVGGNFYGRLSAHRDPADNGRNVPLGDHLTMQPRRQVHPRF